MIIPNRIADELLIPEHKYPFEALRTNCSPEGQYSGPNGKMFWAFRTVLMASVGTSFSLVLK